MKISSSDIVFFRKCIEEYSFRSSSSTDSYDKILFSVCADVYRRLLDDFLSYSKG